MKKIYGIGVGPGGTDLITLRGYKLIRDADVVFLPRHKGKSMAGQITRKFIWDKKTVYIDFPMKKTSSKIYKEAARIIDSNLPDGSVGVFLTIGDPMIYSTFSYALAELEALDIETESVPGIPSFSAAANRANMPVTLRGQEFYLTDGEIDEKVLERCDSVCILKTSGNKEDILNLLENSGFTYMYISRCGWPDQRILYKREEILKSHEYMSLIFGRRVKND